MVKRKTSLDNTTLLLSEPQSVVTREVPELLTLTVSANEAIPIKLACSTRLDSKTEESLITIHSVPEPDVSHEERSTATDGDKVIPSKFAKVQESISMPKEIGIPENSQSSAHSKTVDAPSERKSEVSKEPGDIFSVMSPPQTA